MNKRAKIYCLCVIALGCIALPMQEWSALFALSNEHLFGVASLIGLAVLSEFLAVTATVGRHQASSSIAFIPFFACVMLFPPPVALFVSCVTSVVTQLLVHKRPPLRAAFNSAQVALSLLIGNLVFESLGGRYGTPLGPELLSFKGAVSLGALAVTFFFLNQVFISIAIALMNSERITTVFSRVVAPAGANLLFDVLSSPIAVVVALLYSSFEAGGLLIGILPLLIIRHSYASNVKLQQANKDLLSVLVKTIETRDPYTSGHSIRVSILARAIAEDMDLSATSVDRIEMAGLVHDIGKVDVVYATIIRKEGALTDSERKVIVTHAAKGAEFLTTLSSFRDDVIQGVRHHHERYDGTGYPDALRGDGIPLAARIIQLCDSIDAMLSDRPYRKALSIDHVRSELIRCAGTQFDPRIVEVILRRNTLERAAALVRPEGTDKRTLLVATA